MYQAATLVCYIVSKIAIIDKKHGKYDAQRLQGHKYTTDDHIFHVVYISTRQRFLLPKTSGPDGDVGLLKLL